MSEHKSIEELIEASSLGTPEAVALRESVSEQDARRVVERANALRAAIPDCLVDRPVDPKRKLPIPFVHTADDGSYDFRVLLAGRVVDCLTQQVCSQCGRRLDYWKVFVGGPVSAGTRAYTDPPMHEECALAALSLCPHMNRAWMKRGSENIDPDLFAKPNAEAITAHPGVWVMGMTRGYSVLRASPQHAPLFVARPWRRLRGWRNNPDAPGMTELSDDELAAVIREKIADVPPSQRNGYQL